MQLRQARIKAGLTQSALAEAIGCSQSDISRIESGQRDITLERLKAIAAVLGVPVSHLLADEVA